MIEAEIRREADEAELQSIYCHDQGDMRAILLLDREIAHRLDWLPSEQTLLAMSMPQERRSIRQLHCHFDRFA
ncbi:hypothetical protein [Nonomuraea guangzhouensis]|uniref:Uncharacterized protein n=1 Tax=Nonomuraea guangzhouensis TaxID=1291555 RepID=A0ABW4GZC4_9ACTN|nr:hypothetical protein [Nonomuraea guangzhouensis]